MKLADKTILITGATGFVGLRAVELALQRGMKVKGLVRSRHKITALSHLDVEIIEGDITDPKTMAIACAGADIVLHTAAIVDVGGDPEAFQQVNVNGVVNTAQAAKAADVSCFVHLSSVMVYGFNYPNQVLESDNLRGESNLYCQTKIDSERALLSLAQSQRSIVTASSARLSDMGIIIIRPGDIYGPRGGAWITGPMQRLRQRELILPCWGKGYINYVYVDNLLDGIFLAIEQEAYGEIFNITDGNAATTKEFFTRLARIAKLPAPIALPTKVVRFLFRLYLLGQKLQRKSPILQEASIDWLCRPHGYSIEKAKQVLGYRPQVSLEQGMRLTQEWLQQTGQVR